ncbi:MAG: hypothetical protein IPK61_08175 [Saprospiraceae bacterium]|nr:hypothetical protein [Saprospiraceae bacterium]
MKFVQPVSLQQIGMPPTIRSSNIERRRDISFRVVRESGSLLSGSSKVLVYR